MRFINKGVILNIIVLSLLILSAFSFAPANSNSIVGPLEVCAAGNLNTGVSCVPNIANCPGGLNLFNDEEVKDKLYGTSLANLQTSIQATGDRFIIKGVPYSEMRDRLCLSSNIKAIIGAYKGNILSLDSDDSTDVPTDLTAYFGDTVAFTIPRGCVGEYSDASQSLVSNTGYGAPWGCCPSPNSGVRYQFLMSEASKSGLIGNKVNITEAFAISNKSEQYTACCPSINGRSPAHYYHKAYDDKPAGCLDSNFNVIAAIGDPLIKTTGGAADLPIWGVGLNFAGVMTLGATEGSSSYCPAAAECTIDDEGRIIRADGLKVPGSNIKCVKCFNAGEAIKLSEDGDSLIRCSNVLNSQGIPTDEVGLCNGSASDTLACLSGGSSNLQNSDGTPSNYNLCCKCREAGGVWTGIGCTDTSPLGIITGIIRIVFGVVGGIALLQLIIAGIMYQTGDEARIKSARESIIKTLTGLAVLVFSILILRIIGINILDVLPVGSI